ncbi:hypothetical protein F2P56_032906, partial [Juglans regia]
MEEELESLWKGFTLTDQEKKGFEVTKTEVETVAGEKKFCLQLLVVAEKQVNKEAFRTTMSKLWSPEGWIQFKEMGINKFLMEFEMEQDKKKVLQGHPWTFDRFLVCMEDVDWSAPPNEASFSQESFWIQIHNMPLGSMNTEIGSQIGASIGEIMEIDSDTSGCAW